MPEEEVTEAVILDTGDFDRKMVMDSLKTAEGRKALLKNEVMEPHIHLIVLLLMVFVMTLIIVAVQ